MKTFAELFKISLHDNIVVYLLGNKKKKGKTKQHMYLIFFPLLQPNNFLQKKNQTTGNDVQSLLETSKFPHKSSQEISGAERRLVPTGEPHRCK